MKAIKPGLRLKSAVCTSEIIVIHAADRIELLCTKAGEGSLTLDSEPLLVKQAKALPPKLTATAQSLPS